MSVLSSLFRAAALRTHALAACLMAATAVHAQQGGEFVGIVYPVRDLALSVHVAAVVDQVPVAVGQRVVAGQVILRQDSRVQEVERERRRVILQDRSELDSTEQRRRLIEGLTLDATALFERAGTVSRDEVTKLRLELEAAAGRVEQLRQAKRREQVELDLAERELALRELRAPSAGVITLVKVQPGEWAAPGDALLRLVDETVCELRVNVSPAAARRLATGASVAVRVDDPAVPAPIGGRVTFVSPVIDAASSLVEVRVQFPNADRRIRPGVKGRLRVEGAL
jgi:RND family efflux transporter MFP subunit